MSLRPMPRSTPDDKTSFERPHPKPSASSFHVLDQLHGTALFNIWSASAVLVAGLLGTVLASIFIKAQVESAAQREFDLACNEIRLGIDARLEAGAQLLRSGVALMDAAEHVSRGDWRTFAQRLQIAKHLPGIQGIGFASLIPRGELERHVQAIRSEGFPDYQVWPAGERETYAPVIFLEPFDKLNLRAFGYDTMSESVRRAAMERARDDDAVARSGKVVLVQEIGQDVQAGVMIYAPVYRRGLPTGTIEQRRAAIHGWVYSPYRMTDLMRGTLRHWKLKQNGRRISLQVYDGAVRSTDTLLYDSQGVPTQESASTERMTRLIPSDFAGHRWTLRFTQPGGMAALADYGSVWLVLFGGTMSTLLLAGLMLWQQQRVQFYRKGSAAAEALVASEERFRTAAANLTDVVYDWDIQDTIDWYGDIDNLTGYPPGNFPRTISAWAAILHPEDKARVMAALAAHVQGVAPYNIEYRIRKMDGESRWWSARGTALRDDQGKPYKMIGSISDITERKQAEDQLRVQVAAMEAAAEAIVITDGQGVVTWINPAFTAMTGYEPADIVGRPASTFTPDMQPDPTYGNIQKIIADGKVWRGELVNRRKDGSLYTEEITITPVSDATGVVTNQIAIKKDITERKRMEAQLQQQQQMASVGALARGMAHEVNNPIMGVMNYAELIKEQAVGNAAIIEYADEILAGGWRVAKMTQSLLGFTDQRGSFAFATVILADLVAAVLPQVAATAGEKGIALSCAIPADLPPVSCCRSQIEQVVTTLLTNAIESWEGESLGAGRTTPDSASAGSLPGKRLGGEKKVVIQAAVVADGRLPIDGEADGRYSPRSKIRLTVEDNGPGIRATIQERVFDPFFTTKDRTQHSGLGLWISRTFVHEHGGELTFESEVGRGTRFHLDLPVEGDRNAFGPEEDVLP